MYTADRRWFLIPVFVYLAILFQGFNLQTLSRWHLVVCVFYLCLPVSFVAESPFAVFTNTLSFTVAIGVTMIVIQSPSLINDAIVEYGAAAVWTVHILMHYVPVVINIMYLRMVLWVEFVDCTLASPSWQPWAAFLVSISFGLFYTIKLDPINTYDSPLALHTLVALMAVIFAASELCLLFVLAVFATRDRRLLARNPLAIDRCFDVFCRSRVPLSDVLD